jgi:hypothetical protein
MRATKTKKIIALILAGVFLATTGCYGAEMAALRRENAELKAEQRSKRWANGPALVPQGVMPGTPVPQGNGQVAAKPHKRSRGTAAWLRQAKSHYLCIVAPDDAILQQGRKVALENDVCNGERNIGDECIDGRWNTWLAMRNGSAPVVALYPDPMVEGMYYDIVHQDTGEPMLAPGMTCVFALGAEKKVKLKVRAYMDLDGDPMSPRFAPKPDSEYKQEFDHQGSLYAEPMKYRIHEGRF